MVCRAQLAVLLLSYLCVRNHASAGCATDEDCSLNGRCSTGTCACAPEWAGDDCGVLNLLPAKANNGFHEGPNSSSWGGSIMFDGTTYHMFASRMAGGCGLSAWDSNSEVVRATSSQGDGPYLFQETVVCVPHPAVS